MNETILEPMGMSPGTFARPLLETLRSRATTEHYEEGPSFPGKPHNCPLGGLWTTPSDRARFPIALMQAHRGQSSKILSREMTREMFSPQIETPDQPIGDSYGLDFFGEGSGGGFLIIHAGGTRGLTRILWPYPETGQGTVIMINSADEQALIRFEILLAIAAERDWPLRGDS